MRFRTCDPWRRIGWAWSVPGPSRRTQLELNISRPSGLTTFTPPTTLESRHSSGPLPERAVSWFWPLAIALLVCHAFAAWYLRTPGITTGNDDAVYVQLARSIGDLSYRETYYVGEPGHVKYPPGYPAMLAVLSVFGGERIDLFLAVGALLSAIALGLTADVARRRFSPQLAVLFLLAVVLNPRLVGYAGAVMSEALFLFFLSLSLWAVVVGGDKRKWMIVAALAALAAAMTRSVGVTVIAALCLTWLLRRRYRAAAVTGVAGAVVVGAWFAWTHLAPAPVPGGTGEAYVGDVFLALRRTQHPFVIVLMLRFFWNARRYLSFHLPAQLPLPYIAGTVIDNVVGVTLTLIFIGIGAYVTLRRAPYAVAIVVCYLLLIFLWPWPVSRFISVLLPIAILMLLSGAAAAAERVVHERWALVVPALLALVLAGTSTWKLAETFEQARACDRSAAQTSPGCFNDREREFLAMSRWVADSIPRAAVFVVAKEGTFGYFASRQTVPHLRVVRADTSRVLRVARELGATHMVLSQIKEPKDPLLDLFQPHCGSLEPVKWIGSMTLVLRFREDSEPPSAAGCEAFSTYRRNLEAT